MSNPLYLQKYNLYKILFIDVQIGRRIFLLLSKFFSTLHFPVANFQSRGRLSVLFRTSRYLHHVPGECRGVEIMMNESSGLARLLMLDGKRKVVRLSRRMVQRRLMRMKPREGWSRVRDEGDGKRDETGIK